MRDHFVELEAIFNRTTNALLTFTDIIIPIIDSANDDHQRLYWHHIYEEEDHRHDRLKDLIPKLSKLIENKGEFSTGDRDFIHLLQDISLEKFGLHNFLEHLDLSLFQFKDTEFEQPITELRDMTAKDYQETKSILAALNEQFKGGINMETSTPTDEKSDVSSELKMEAYSNKEDVQVENDKPQRLHKRFNLTVGSLKKS